MSKKMHREIEEDLAARREEASREAARRKAVVYQQIPEMEELDGMIRRTGLALGRACLTGGGRDPKVLEEELAELRARKAHLLASHGVAADYCEQTFYCPLCQDRGYVEREEGPVRCSCYTKLLIEKLMRAANISEQAGGFASFDLNYYPETADRDRYGIAGSPRLHMADVLSRCEQFVEGFAEGRVRNLALIGKSGLGKTHLCQCISWELLHRGVPVLYLTAPMLFQALTIPFGLPEEERASAQELKDLIFQAELLILDDLGTEKPTATRYAELLEVFNAREMAARTRPCKTVLSTNLEPKNIFDYYGERVASRILGDFDVLRFVGDDIRLLRKR